MKIKVGQWARTKYGFGNLLKTDKVGNYLFEKYDGKTFICQSDNIGLFADNPQELVQVDDFIIYQQIGARLNHVRKNEIVFQQFYKSIVIKKENYNMITAIYTPNADKTQYTEQWRKGDTK